MKQAKYILPVIILFSARALFAQNIPPGSGPDSQAERYRKSAEEQKQKLEQKKIKPPEVEIPQEKEKPQPAKEVSFLLKEVTVTGVTLFSQQEIFALYSPYLNTTVNFAVIQGIAKNIEAKYAAAGFLTTTAYIPEQDISGGKVEIRVIEGRMGDIKIEGNKYFSSALIKKYIHVMKNDPLNIKTLQTDLLRLNKSPDLEVRSVLEAGATPGTSDIVMKVKDKFPNHLGFGSDNQGTRLTGKYRGSVFLFSSNLTGNFDSLYINSLFSYLSLGESLSYTVPVGTRGASFGLDLVYFSMVIGKDYKPLDISGISEICVPHFSWELLLSEDTQAYANTGIEIKSVTKRISGIRSADDQLRLPYFGFTFTRSDAWKGGGQTYFTPNFSFGTEHFLGASSQGHTSASRSGTGGFFFKYEQGLNRIQRTPFDSYVRIRTQFQAASHSLPSSEQLQLGGLDSVRGYPEGDYSADNGVFTNLDWVMPMYLIPKSWSWSGSKVNLRHLVEPVLFFDTGVGSLKHVGASEVKDKFLAGLGAGFRFNLGKAYLRLDFAKHVGDKPTGGSGASTFYLQFQSEF